MKDQKMTLLGEEAVPLKFVWMLCKSDPKEENQITSNRYIRILIFLGSYLQLRYYMQDQ